MIRAEKIHRKLRRALVPLFACWLAFGLPASGTAASPPDASNSTELRLSIAPYLSPARMAELYTPIAASLSQALGRRVIFRTSSTFERNYEQVAAGEIDLTLVHAFFYVVAVDQYGYLPLARMIEPFKGLLVVPEQSPARTLADLRGEIIATPPDYLPTVHLLRQTMRGQHFDPSKDFVMRSFRSVESCLQQLVIGEAAGCVCPPFALPGAEARLKVRFRTIVESESIPNLTFIVHPRVPAAERNRLREAILQWSKSDTGRALIRRIGTSSFIAAHDTDYTDVRRLLKNLDSPWLPTPR